MMTDLEIKQAVERGISRFDSHVGRRVWTKAFTTQRLQNLRIESESRCAAIIATQSKTYDEALSVLKLPPSQDILHGFNASTSEECEFDVLSRIWTSRISVILMRPIILKSKLLLPLILQV